MTVNDTRAIIILKQVFIKFSVKTNLPWGDFLNKTDYIHCCSFKFFFGFLFKSSSHILCHSVTRFSPIMEQMTKRTYMY